MAYLFALTLVARAGGTCYGLVDSSWPRTGYARSPSVNIAGGADRGRSIHAQRWLAEFASSLPIAQVAAGGRVRRFTLEHPRPGRNRFARGSDLGGGQDQDPYQS